MIITKAQRAALKRIWLRTDGSVSYLAFRRKVGPGPGCIMAPLNNMWLGIEPDGYTHS